MPACERCNCFVGSPGNRACDVELTRKYLRPRIPPECPKGLYGLSENLLRPKWPQRFPHFIRPSKIEEAIA